MLSATALSGSQEELEFETQDSGEEGRSDVDSSGHPYPTLAGHSSDEFDEGNLVIDEDASTDAGNAISQESEINGAMAMEVEGQWLSALFSFIFLAFSRLSLFSRGNIPNLSLETAKSTVFHTWLGLFLSKYLWNSTICRHIFLQLLLFV